jgi:hypothetical protein
MPAHCGHLQGIHNSEIDEDSADVVVDLEFDRVSEWQISNFLTQLMPPNFLCYQ